MRPCEHCAQSVADDAIVCPNCGTPTAQKSYKLLTGNRHFDEVLGGLAGIAAGVAVIWFDLAVVRPVPGQADAGIFVVVHVIALAGLIAFSAWALRRGVAPFARAALLGFTIVTSVVLGLLTACFAMFGSY